MINKLLFLLFFFFSLALICKAQKKTVFIQGTVIDSTTGSPLQQVSVFQNSSGSGTLTDQDGNYRIALTKNGILRFSYLGYKDVVVPIRLLAGDQNFNISLSVLPYFTPELNITARKMYKLDSINYRKDNKNVFAAKRHNSYGYTSAAAHMVDYGAGLTISPSSLYNNYVSAHASRLRAYRKTLEKSEKATYIDSRFSKPAVNRITGLSGPDLDTFMVKSRPEYEWLIKSSDYDLDSYIQKKFSDYKITALK